VYDEVLNPALSLAEQDRHRGRLDEQRQAFIHRALRDMIEELGDEWRLRQDRDDADAMKAAAAATVAAAKGTGVLDSASKSAAKMGGNGSGSGGAGASAAGNGRPAPAASSGTPTDLPPAAAPGVRVPSDCTVNVVLLPAHDEADEISGLMLAQLLEFRGYCAFAQSVTKLAAHVVVVSAMPPAAVAHSRYLCKRLHARFPDANMVVGLWTMKGDVKKAKDRVTCVGSVQVATELKTALEQIGQLAQPVIVAADARTTAPAAV